MFDTFNYKHRRVTKHSTVASGIPGGEIRKTESSDPGDMKIHIRSTTNQDVPHSNDLKLSSMGFSPFGKLEVDSNPLKVGFTNRIS